MNEDQLQIEYSRLMKDVSALPDTTPSRYRIDEYGTYHLADSKKVTTKEERTIRVLGAIYPFFPAEQVENERRKSQGNGLHHHPSNYLTVSEALKNDDRKCVTDNFDIRLILLLLRYEGVIEFGKTPLCQGKDTKKYLYRLISESDIPYKDTLLKLLDEQLEKLFIDYDPDESERDKVNRAVMLLSLLSQEEIREYGMKKMDLAQFGKGSFCWFFERSIAPFAPLLLLRSAKVKEILRNPLLKKDFYAKRIDKMIDDYGILLTDEPVAVGNLTYLSVLRQCAVSGISCDGWLFKVNDAYGNIVCPPQCNRFILEHLNKEIVERIYQEEWCWLPKYYQEDRKQAGLSPHVHPGHYLIALDEEGYKEFSANKIDEVDFNDFRQFIVQRADLRSIGKSMVTKFTNGVTRRFYLLDLDFDLSSRKDDAVKVINCDNIEAGIQTVMSPIKAFIHREYNESAPHFGFVSPSVIGDNGWRLDPDLYWTRHISEMHHPVLLGKVINPLKLGELVTPKSRERLRQDIMDTRVMIDSLLSLEQNRVPMMYKTMDKLQSRLYVLEEDFRLERYKTGCVLDDLQDRPLDNYREHISPEDMSPYFDGLFYKLEPRPSSYGILLVDKSDPASHPSYYVVPGNEPLYILKELADCCYCFEVKEDYADPWFLACIITGEADQCSLRLTDGTDEPIVRMESFLTIFVDLPPVQEQVKFIETFLREDLKKRRSQLGVAEALLNLSHTIGGPSNRIQTLLGELEESMEGNEQVVSSLRKIGDNFDYIMRLVNTFSRDFERYPVALKSTPVVPLIEKSLHAVANLPLGLTPELVSCTVSRDRSSILNDTMFEVMMDNIFRNAYRHGFNRTASPENKVGVFLTEVSVNGAAYLLMSVCNNGRPLEPGFTVHDFIERGKIGGSTGNSGQGGHDIYQIIKKFKGYLSLRSDTEWNFIIDILLPLEPAAGGSGNIEMYPYGPLV